MSGLSSSLKVRFSPFKKDPGKGPVPPEGLPGAVGGRAHKVRGASPLPQYAQHSAGKTKALFK